MGYKEQKNMSCFSMMKKNRSFNVTYNILAGKKMTELSSSGILIMGKTKSIAICT
jgi:hypothetical protein